MILLVSGTTRTLSRLAPANRNRLGFLLTPNNRNSVEAITKLGIPLAVDNGCFGGLDVRAFRRCLARVSGRNPLWIVCPDVVADVRATIALWSEWRDEVAAAGTPAFVLQDGQENLPLPEAEAYFIGGSTEFKLSRAAADLAAEVKRRGAWLHVGRVNSRRRIKHCWSLNADSFDGTSASMFGDVYVPKYLNWMREMLPWVGADQGHDVPCEGRSRNG